MATASRYWRLYYRSTGANGTAAAALSLKAARWFAADGTELSASLVAANLTTSGTLLNSTSYPLTNLVDDSLITETVFTYSVAISNDIQSWRYIQFDFGVGNAVLPDYVSIAVGSTSYATYTVAATSLHILIQASTDGVTFVPTSMMYNPISGYNALYRVPTVPSSSLYPIPPRESLGGTGGIYGIVSEDGVALPNRPVYLFERDTFFKVGYATTDSNGGYAFNGLNENREFMVMSVDPSGPPYKNALVWDRIQPINTLGNLTPQSSFWARRARDVALGGIWSPADYLSGTTYRFFKGNIIGGASQLWDDLTFYWPFTYDTVDAVGGSLKFLKSTRIPSDARYGITAYPSTGTPLGTNAAGTTANYANLTFEYIIVTPVAGESGLIITWGGTRDADDVQQFGMDAAYSAVGKPTGFTAEISTTGITIRANLSGINRSTSRGTYSLTPGTMYHLMITYVQDDVIKLYVNGALVLTTSIAGGGRLWGHSHTNNLNAIGTENWDHSQSVNYDFRGAIRRFNALNICGYGLMTGVATTSNYLQVLGPGFGGSVALAAMYHRTFADSDVATFYDSFINWDSHIVPATQSGYMGEVEASNANMYYRLNEAGTVTKMQCVVGGKDRMAYYEGAPLFNQTGFVSGSPSVNTSAGGAVVLSFIEQTFTLEMFARPTSLTGTQYLIGVRQSSGSNLPIQLYHTAGVLYLSVVDVTGTTATFPLGYTLVANTDYHIAVTYDPWGEKLLRLVINGVQVSTQSAGVLPDTTGTGWIGIGTLPAAGAASYGSRFQGRMSDVAIYHYVVPTASLLAHYEARNS